MWQQIESKNMKKKLLRAVRVGDDADLARRGDVFRSVDPNWQLPMYLRELLPPRHCQRDDMSWAHPPHERPPRERYTPVPSYRQAVAEIQGAADDADTVNPDLEYINI